MPPKRRVECFFDGACQGNQFEAKRPMRVAYVVGMEEHAHAIPDLPSPRGPLRSNNIAEYQALILLLHRLHELQKQVGGTESYVIHGDSQLVIRQMLGTYRVKEPHLAGLHAAAHKLSSDLPVSFLWIPRDKNRAGFLLE